MAVTHINSIDLSQTKIFLKNPQILEVLQNNRDISQAFFVNELPKVSQLEHSISEDNFRKALWPLEAPLLETSQVSRGVSRGVSQDLS